MVPSSLAHFLPLPYDGPAPRPPAQLTTCMTSGELPEFIETQFLFKSG